jgi:hypothetical protein
MHLPRPHPRGAAGGRWGRSSQPPGAQRAAQRSEQEHHVPPAARHRRCPCGHRWSLRRRWEVTSSVRRERQRKNVAPARRGLRAKQGLRLRGASMSSRRANRSRWQTCGRVRFFLGRAREGRGHGRGSPRVIHGASASPGQRVGVQQLGLPLVLHCVSLCPLHMGALHLSNGEAGRNARGGRPSAFSPRGISLVGPRGNKQAVRRVQSSDRRDGRPIPAAQAPAHRRGDATACQAA